jgi:hypothetical protein
MLCHPMEDFKRDYVKEHFAKLTPEQQREVLQALPPQKREQLRQYLDELTAGHPAKERKPRRRK